LPLQLTGLWAFYDTEDDRAVRAKVLAGERAELPPVSPRGAAAPEEERKLEQLMRRCWEPDPERRIDIFQAVAFLRDAVAASDRLLNATQSEAEDPRG
jgi:hypothetical protein